MDMSKTNHTYHVTKKRGFKYLQSDISSNTNSCCLEEGFDLIINCTLNPSLLPRGITTNKTLHLKRNSTEIRTIDISTSDQGMSVLIPTVTENDTAWYHCCLHSNCTRLYFIIRKAPPRPTDFECVIRISQGMECTWTSKEKCVNWSLQYETKPDRPTLRSDPLNQIECDSERTPIVHDCESPCALYVRNEGNTCIKNVWRLQSPPSLGVVYNFNLTGTGVFGASNYHYSFNAIYAIKLDDLSDCSHDFNGSTIAKVWCESPWKADGFQNGIECNITTESIYSSNSINKVYTTGTKICHRLDKCHPYTLYSVSLMCQVRESRYWANPIVYNFTTPEDVPLVGPLTSNQSYSVWYTDVIIYIKPPSVYQRQGKLTGYTLHVESSMGSLNKTFKEDETSLRFSSSNLTNSVNYKVTIWSQTKRGYSVKGTLLFIVLNSSSAIISEVIVEKLSSKYLVTWKRPANTFTNCIYHWCLSKPSMQDGKDYVTCLENYNFNESTLTQSYITPLEEHNGLSWYFGVSQENTGIRWQDCVFANGQPPQKPDRITVSGNEFTVPFCSKELQKGPRPISYLVLYYNINKDTEQNISIPASLKTTFSAKQLGLNGETNYSVKYKIIYSGDRQSDYSDLVSIKIKAYESLSSLRSSSTLKEILKIAGSIIAAIVFLIAVLYLMYNAFKKWKNIDVNIDTVEMPVSDTTESYEEKIEITIPTEPDSGRHTLSSTVTDKLTFISPTSEQHTHINFSRDDHYVLATTKDNLTISTDIKMNAIQQLPPVTDMATSDDVSSSDSCAIEQINSSRVVFSKNQDTGYIQVTDIHVLSTPVVTGDHSRKDAKECSLPEGCSSGRTNASCSLHDDVSSSDSCAIEQINSSRVVFSKNQDTGYIQVAYIHLPSTPVVTEDNS
ncbi:uncharacterized protein LOC132548159 [Ylistrum balloti]|uniref:uncharacterized protein LOC132548159 n=1 Tax=Ylistrum balloti TaxID=509963 RepID=UPI002905C691|nr:uncharacterized protein LOC132548159 [Ylistrum balloti]